MCMYDPPRYRRFSQPAAHHSSLSLIDEACNCIYLITCSHCGTQYVGQTKKKLLTRFNSHFYDIHQNNDTTVARHFNKCPPHNPAKTDDLSISVLSFIRAPPDTKAGPPYRRIFRSGAPTPDPEGVVRLCICSY